MGGQRRGAVAHHRRCLRRRGQRALLRPHHRGALLLPLHAGGLGLHGSHRLRHGQAAAQDRSVGPLHRAAADRLRLQRAQRHGEPHTALRARPQADGDADALHVVHGEAAHLRLLLRRLLPGQRSHGDVCPLPAGHPRGHRDGTGAEEHGVQGRGSALRHGAAQLPHAWHEDDAAPPVGQGARLPGACLHRHLHGDHRDMVPADVLLPSGHRGGRLAEHPGPSVVRRGPRLRPHRL